MSVFPVSRPWSPRPLKLLSAAAWPVWFIGSVACSAAQAQGLAPPAPHESHWSGISAIGATGGLVIPSAHVLAPGTVALSSGSYQEPGLGKYRKRENYSLGLGVAPYLELFGRFAEYQNPLSGSRFNNGPRDISANVKIQLPVFDQGGPKVAVGVTDFEGGAIYFRSMYGVVSDEWGPLRWSAGLAKGSSDTRPEPTFNGIFGGVEFKLGGRGLTALAEHDGKQRHVGLRYYSQPLPWLGHAQLLGTLHRSLGVASRASSAGEQTSFQLSLVVPLGPNEDRMARSGSQIAPGKELPAINAQPSSGSAPVLMDATDRLESIQKALVATGLERVRVGRIGDRLVVEYENHLFGQNEADALGIVFGLAAEWAPTGIQRIHAVTLKSGQRIHDTAVDLPAYRAFLRDGASAAVQAGMKFAWQGSGDLGDLRDIQWATGSASSPARLRVQFSPEVNYTLGTEVGAFDYSVGLSTRLVAPLWKGAEAYVNHVSRLADSPEFEPAGVYGSSRIRQGVKTAAVQQSMWLAPRVMAQVSFGQFNYDFAGFEAEGRMGVRENDLIRLRAARYERTRDSNPILSQQGVSASYRWAVDPRTWVEVAYQDYTDGSRGPAVSAQRWFGDIGWRLFMRKGGTLTYAGLELVLPLSPRKGSSIGPVQFNGSPMWEKGFRTKLTNAQSPANTVAFDAVREFAPSYNLDGEVFNASRASQGYYLSQLQRMREAFYMFAREHAPKL